MEQYLKKAKAAEQYLQYSKKVKTAKSLTARSLNTTLKVTNDLRIY